jgi:competence protein ComEC
MSWIIFSIFAGLVISELILIKTLVILSVLILFSVFPLFYYKKFNKFKLPVIWFSLTLLSKLIIFTISPAPYKNIFKVIDSYKTHYGKCTVYGNLNQKLHILRNEKCYKTGSLLILNSKTKTNPVPLKAEFKTKFPKPDLLKAMTVGAPSPVKDKTLLKNLGLSHILAISGLHISIIVLISLLFSKLIFFFIPYRFQIEKKYIDLLFSFPSIWFYCFYTGAHISTIRASIMYSLFLLLIKLHGIGNRWSALVFAMVVLLIQNPQSIFSPSFQMSFGAVFGIFLFLPLGTNRFSKYIFVSIGATLATTPLIYYHFNYFYPYTFLINILFLPIFSLIIIPVGIFGYILSSFIPNTSILLTFSNSILKLILSVLESIYNFLPLYNPGFTLIIFSFTLILFSFLAIKPSVKKSFTVLLFLPVFIILNLLEKPQPIRGLKITFIGGGNQDTTLIQTKDKNILIDGGNKNLLKILRRKRINKIDLIILSHNHEDHYYGIDKIAGIIKIIKLYHNGKILNSLEYKLRKQGVIIQAAPAFWKVDNLEFTLLNQTKNGVSFNSSFLSENNSSLVVLIKYFNKKLLFVGDLEKFGEYILLKNSKFNFRVDLLKVGHHGRSTSTSDNFIKSIQPEYSIIMGENPSPFTISVLKKYRSKIIVVNREKSIIFNKEKQK